MCHVLAKTTCHSTKFGMIIYFEIKLHLENLCTAKFFELSENLRNLSKNFEILFYKKFEKLKMINMEYTTSYWLVKMIDFQSLNKISFFNSDFGVLQRNIAELSLKIEVLFELNEICGTNLCGIETIIISLWRPTKPTKEFYLLVGWCLHTTG